MKRLALITAAAAIALLGAAFVPEFSGPSRDQGAA